MENAFFLNRFKIKPLISKWKKEGYKIAFTSGTFDLLHLGHILYLNQVANYSKTKSKLIVGVNSDASVSSYKDPSRPINFEQDRLRLVEALKFVDAAFIFNELNNKNNILELKPDYYLKAGDYDLNALSSAKYLSTWGGKADIINFEPNYSSTGIIEKILLNYSHRYQDEIPRSIDINNKRKPAIFIDRDGVINHEVEYLYKVADFKLIPGVIEGLKKFMLMDFRLILITNQSGIGLGYFSESDFFKLNKNMLKLFHQEGILIDKIYFCPHPLTSKCNCRKPKTGLIERAKKEACIDLEKSYLIGDKTSDILAGKRMKLKTIIMETGHGGKDGQFEVTPDFKAKDLIEAADLIKQDSVVE